MLIEVELSKGTQERLTSPSVKLIAHGLDVWHKMVQFAKVKTERFNGMKCLCCVPRTG